MKITRIIFIAYLVGLCAPVIVWAGGMTAFFGPGDRKLPEVLPHLDNKALIVEFRDPKGSGVGTDVALVLWREVLSAISDQAGAGVVVAQRNPDQPIIDLQKGDYHLAAQRIAKRQRTWAAVWGNVDVVGDQLYIESYLSLLPEAVQVKPLLQLYFTGKPIPELSAPMPRSLYSFRLQTLKLDSLFNRAVVTRRSVRLLSNPRQGSAVVARVPGERAMQMLEMRDNWMHLQTPEGNRGYLQMTEDSPVDILPVQVEGRDKLIRLRSSPGTERPDNILATTRLPGHYKVLDRRYIPGKGTWFQIDYKGQPAWVAAWIVDTQYSLPSVEFVAGLLRYQASNYEGAARHFQRYITLAKDYERNVNIAAAYQLLGAARMRQGSHGWVEGLAAFSSAAKMTPYDPNAHAIYALASIGPDGWVDSAVPQLSRALQLDEQNPLARSITRTLEDASKGDASDLLETSLHFDANSKALLNTLVRDYRIRSKNY